MSSHTSTTQTEGEGPMILRNRGRAWRLMSLALAAGLVFALAGDRGRAQGYPVSGINPLEVLELKLKPNVIVVLDSSGSMGETLARNGGYALNILGGDHPESKMGKAKAALKQIFERNETRASFAFASYTQVKEEAGWMGDNEFESTTTLSLPEGGGYYGTRYFRFIYFTSDLVSAELQTAYSQAAPANDNVQVARAAGDTATRGFQAWQDINPQHWGSTATQAYLYWTEGGTPCSVPITTAFYRTGASLATELQTRMNTCGSATYTVTYNAGTGRFAFSATSNFTMYWLPSTSGAGAHSLYSPNRPSIGPVLGDYDPGDPTDGPTTYRETPVAFTLAHRTAATTAGGCADNDRYNEACYVENGTTYYNLYASRFFNGETIVSDANGNVCDVLPATAASTAVSPGADGVAGTVDDTPVLWVRRVTTCGDVAGQDVPFLYAGPASNAKDVRRNSDDRNNIPDGRIDRGLSFNNDPYANSNGCGGIQFRADLRPCDSACLQYNSQIEPWLEAELPLTAGNELLAGHDAGGVDQLYTESADGLYRATTAVYTPSGGLRASGSTPIARTLQNVKGTFTGLWNTAGPSDCPAPNGTGAATAPFGAHVDPAAPTIVIFVSDGDDTCAGGSTDQNALAAALAAENLFAPVDATADPGTSSSVRTYMIAFGEGANPTRLNWIAWGGSGLGQNRLDLGMPDVSDDGTRWTPGGNSNAAIDANLRVLRDLCASCTDALIARDGAELEKTLQAIIDQSATSGSYSAARQSITDSVYEYVWQANGPQGTFDPTDKDTRFDALAPTRFISVFTLPGFKGELQAWQAYDWNSDGQTPDLAWSAGAKLLARVQGGTGLCATPNQCTFSELATYVDRRIYTTPGNGVYGPGATPWGDNPAALAGVDATLGGTVAGRVVLWPPETGVLAGNFDDELGIAAMDLASLKTAFGACEREAGATLPVNCDPNTASPAAQLTEARKEARELILAFMAGAEPIGTRAEPRRKTTAPYGLVYRSRPWVLADTTQASPSLLGPPLPDKAGDIGAEYGVFISGPQSAGGAASSNTDRGCGLRDPEAGVQPTMTVAFLPSNDMLHAFRAGPCYGGACTDSGGEELWGFVPYDVLPALRERFIEDPQSHDNHVYMLARGVRYADVFFKVPTTLGAVCGGGDSASLEGVWRRVAFVGRGAGGKFLTALDVTSAGDLTTSAVSARGPIPLWSRGNPDTVEATRERVGVTPNHNAGDVAAYSHMGETWSMPAVGLVDYGYAPYDASPRNPARNVAHALFMGSGYGDASGCAAAGPCEGTTFYTLDAVTGDVLATADVGRRAEMVPTGPADEVRWDNALVANVAGFNPRLFGLGRTVHPSSYTMTRVYIGDLHGRLWKFLTRSPDIAIEMANLSTVIDPADPAAAPVQPVAIAAGLLGLPPYQGNVNMVEPYIYVNSGYDRRAKGPFKIFGFRDTGGDTDTQLGTPRDNPDDPVICPAPCNVRTYDGNAGSELVLARWFDEGAAQGTCANPIPGNVFRGTVQPATTFELCNPASPTCTLALGRVFFGGTRLNLPGTQFAPPTPIACGTGEYPCRSSFDSIVYALGAETGLAAYDINATGDDAYRIYRDQRISALSLGADPAQGGGSRLLIDEGHVNSAAPVAPPPAGVPPNAVQSGSASVVLSRDASLPPPSVRLGSMVCQ